jgi:hypothetical protein
MDPWNVIKTYVCTAGDNAPGTHWTKACAGSTVGLHVVVKTNIPISALNRTPVIQSVSVTLITELPKLTPWSATIFKKLIASQLVKQFPAFYGTRRFITVNTRSHH